MRKLLLLTTALYLLMMGPALADPITGIGLLIGGLTGALTTTQIVFGVISMGATWLMGQMMKPKEKQRGVKTKMETGGDKPPGIVLGEYATTGALDYVNVSDTGHIPNSYLTYVIILSALPVDGLSNYVYINGERCTALWGAQDADGFSYVDEYEKNDSHYVRLKFYDGTQTAADPWLLDKFGDDEKRPWLADMHLAGCAYVIAVCGYSNMGVWTGNPEFRWVVRGKPVYDPRKDSSVGGSGPQRWNTPSTYTFSKNAKVIEYNIIRGLYYKGDLVWGGGAEAYRLPLDYWFAAMNVCDENIEKKNGTIINRYEVGAEIHFDDKPIEIIDEINKATCGYTTEYGGTYKTWCGSPGLSVATITDDDFLISAEMETNRSQALQNVYNTAYGTYPEPDEQWEIKDGPQYQDADALAEDGQELAIDIALPLVSENNQLQRVMRATVKDSRRQVTHAGQLSPEAFVFEPNDRISFISSTFGYHGDGKDFILSSKEDLANVNQQVLLRELNPDDTGWLKAYELDHRVGALTVVKPGTLDLDFTVAASQIDSATGKDKPAMLATWDWSQIDIDVQNILWEVRRAGTTDVIAEGRIRNPQNGARKFTDTIFRFGRDYQIRLKPEPFSDRQTSWTGWKSVTLVNLDIPSAPTLTPVSILADDGSQVFRLKIDWPGLAAEVRYTIRILVDGDYRYKFTDESRFVIDAASSETFTVDVRAVGADGDSKGGWSPSTTVTVTKKATNNTPPTGLTVVGKFGSNIVRPVRPTAMKDFKEFNIYVASVNNFASASLLDNTPASRFSHNDLGNNVTRFYWATTVDRTGNESTKYPVSNTGGIAGTTLPIVDGDADQTPPGTPTAPTLNQYTADVDGDSTVDTGLEIVMALPSGVPVKFFEVQIFRANTLGGTYSSLSKRPLVKAESSGTTTYAFEGSSSKFYKARYRGISFSGKEGPFSLLNATGIQPLQYLSSIPTPTMTVTPKTKGMALKWTKWQNSTYLETIIYRDGVELIRIKGNAHTDNDELTVATGYTYTCQHMDKQERVGALSTGVTATYRAALTADISAKAITPTLTDLGDTSNIVIDNNLREPDAWVATSLINQAVPNIVSASQYRFVLAATIAVSFIQNAPAYRQPVEGGKRYTYSASIGSNLGLPDIYDILINWFSRDASGNPVNAGQIIVATFTGSTITKLTGNVVSPASASWAEIVARKRAGAVANGLEFNEPVLRRTVDTDLLGPEAVTDDKANQTAPLAPGVPGLTTVTADIDGDGTIDTGLHAAWTAPGSGVPARLYELEVWRCSTSGGTYTFWKRFTSFDLSYDFKASSSYFYKALVSAKSFNNITGADSALTATGVQPLQYSGTVQVASLTSVTRKPKGNFLVWPKCTDKNYKETIVLLAGVEIHRIKASSWTDQTERTPGASCSYTVQHVDTQDRVGAVSSAIVVVYRVASATASDNDFTTTALAAPSATDPTPNTTAASVVFVQENQDVNGDGSVDIALTASINAVTDATSYEYEVTRWNVGSSSWVATGKSTITAALSYTFIANTSLKYRVRARARNAYGQPGNWTTNIYTTGTGTVTFASFAGLQPAPKPGLPTAPSTVTIDPVPLGVSLTWLYASIGDPDYKYTEIFWSPTSTAPISTTPPNIASSGVSAMIFIGVSGFRVYAWVRHVNNSGQKSAWVAAGNALTATVDGTDLLGLTVGTNKIVHNAVNEPFVAGNNSPQTLPAGRNMVQDLVVSHGSGADMVVLTASFRNTTGGSRTVDISIEDNAGNVLAFYPGYTLLDGEYCPCLEAVASSTSGASTTYRIYVEPASAMIINRTRLGAKVGRR